MWLKHEKENRERKGWSDMTGLEIVSMLIAFFGLVFSGVAIMFTVKGSKRTDVKDIEARVIENTTINLKLDNVAKDTAEIKEEVRLQRREVQNLSERMAKVEASAKQAHHRIDRMEGTETRNES